MRNLSIVMGGLSIVFLTFPVYAANPLSVVINEIAWMGTEEGWQYEWIELYNNKEEKINISGWKIENAGAKNKTLEIPTGEIPSKGFFLICKKAIKNCDFTTWALSLSNDYKENGRLILKDGLNNIIDQTPEPKSKEWSAGNNKTKQTMERKGPQLEGSDLNNWQTSQNSGGTPKTKNSIVAQKELQPQIKPVESVADVKPQQPIIYPSGILLNEILPSPEGSDEKEEWIEIFNQNNLEVDLSNWQIADTIGKTNIYTFPIGIKIPPQGFLVLSRQTTKITLNNNGDGLNLILPDGNIIDSVTYEKAPRGQSFNRINSKWVWSKTITPGSINATPALISEAKKTELSKEIPSKNKKESSKKELAAIGEQMPKEKAFFSLLLIALSLAIFSGIIILIVKKKIKGIDLAKKLE